jgi:hypothetical protein
MLTSFTALPSYLMNCRPLHYFGKIPTAAAFNMLFVFGVYNYIHSPYSYCSAYIFTALVQLISGISEFSYKLLLPNKGILDKHAITTQLNE